MSRKRLTSPAKTYTKRKCRRCRGSFRPDGSRETLCPWCKAAEFAVRSIYWLKRATESR